MQANGAVLEQLFPCWESLAEPRRRQLRQKAAAKHFLKGAMLHGGGEDCTGLLLVQTGRLRVYILSPDGKEITLYRLFEGDVCLFSAACVLQNIHFDVHISAEKDAEVIVVPAKVYGEISKESLPLADYTNQLMAARFSDVMWVIEQVLFTSFGSRLATFLLEQARLENSETVTITHEEIARHLGSAREVVTRMLNYFAGEEMVTLSRGEITLVNTKKIAGLIG
ncbi:MAG: Crp/Fnr family transcriptional regulator [Oscillospiraceae bacterium]